MSGSIDINAKNAKRDSTVTVRDSILQKYKREKKDRGSGGETAKVLSNTFTCSQTILWKTGF